MVASPMLHEGCQNREDSFGYMAATVLGSRTQVTWIAFKLHWAGAFRPKNMFTTRLVHTRTLVLPLITTMITMVVLPASHHQNQAT